MSEALNKIRIKKVLGPINAGTAVLLGNEDKTFVMFIGTYEGAAILREINDEKPPRPMTHDLLEYVMTGFEIQVKKVVISSIVDNTFCATLVLQQECKQGEEWTGRRNEVHIDARPSDCLVLALKTGVDIYATDQVLEKVHDISEGLQLQGGAPSSPQTPFGLKELDLSGLDGGLDSGGESTMGFDEEEDEDEL